MNASQNDQVEKLGQAIAALEAQRSVLGSDVVDASIAALEKQIVELQARAAPSKQQRKLATLLFADIVGSTRLVQELDPEEYLAIMEGALARLAAVVESHGGHIARYQGDGFKAVFGLPTAGEHDPENAVRAGLGIIEAAQEYANKVQERWNLDGFAVRVGIDTGLVIGGGVMEAEDTIVGLAVNLAARLESAAPPDSLLISHRTYQHIRGIFDVAPQESITVKGFPDPIPVHLVLGEKPRAFRLGWRGVEGIETKTIGRDRELRTLQEAYETATGQQRTAVVTIVGDAGVGKSRLVLEFTHWLELRSEKIWHFKGRASPQTQDIPHALLRFLLADRFLIRDSDRLETVRQKLVDGIGRFLPDEGEMKAHVLGAWLGYDFGASPHMQFIKDDPAQLKDQATLYLTQLFAAACAEGPALILLDDIHWADQRSLDVVLDLVRRQPRLPLLIVCVARPSLYERRSDWDDEPLDHARLDLAPLSEPAMQTLVSEILRLMDPLPPLLLDTVVGRAEGNPFYAEELVKMLVDDGVIITAPDVWRLVPEKLVAFSVPPTLTGVLQSRLDRLRSPEKEAIQKAAVIGRTFWDEALAALQHKAQEHLPTLQNREFIFPRQESAFVGTREYIFKHALLRDVVYETVLKRVQRASHKLVADWLVAAAETNGRTDEYAALIGEHFQSAGEEGRAAVWFGRAGQQATATFAHEEAIHYLTLALQFTPDGDDEACFAHLEAREKAYDMQGNRGAQREDLEALTALANRLSLDKQAVVALRWAKFAEVTNDYAQAEDHARKAIELGRQGNGLSLVAEGHWALGNVLWRQGQYPPSEEQFKTGLELAKEVGDQRQAGNCYHGLGIVTYLQGEYETAKAFYEEALAIRRAIGYRYGEGTTLNNMGIVANDQGNYALAKQYYEQALAIRREVGYRHGEGSSLNNLGGVAMNQGDYAAAERYYEQSLDIDRETGTLDGEGISFSNLGSVAHDQGKYDAAGEYLERSLAICREIGNRLVEGINLQKLGALALAQGNYLLADSYFRRALAIRQEMDLPHYVAEDWAGLARAQLAQGDLDGAQEYGEHFLAYLKENPRLDGAEDRMRAFRFAWEVFTELANSEAAGEILLRAIEVIRRYLDNNDDPSLQAMYLKQPHHATMWQAWLSKREN